MIIKSTSRKSPSFSQLYDYITNDLKTENSQYFFNQNTFSISKDDVLRDFIINSKNLSKRKGANYLYHEIISIKRDWTLDLDRQKEILQDLVSIYSENRAKRNLVFGAMHTDKEDNLHYHLMISANELGKNTRYRLTKKKFNLVKSELEEYLLHTYPELKQDRLISKNKAYFNINKTEKEYQSTKRTGGKSQKEKVKESILELISEPLSQKAFIFKCRDLGIEPYVRGESYGVIFNGKKFRLQTLGLDEIFKKYERDYLLTKSEKNERYQQKGKHRNESKNKHFQSSQTHYNQSYREDYEDLNRPRSQRGSETEKEVKKRSSAIQNNVYNSEFERDYEDLKKSEQRSTRQQQTGRNQKGGYEQKS